MSACVVCRFYRAFSIKSSVFQPNSGHISRIVVTLHASSSYQNDDKVKVKIITKKETCRSNKQNKSFESESVVLADFFT